MNAHKQLEAWRSRDPENHSYVVGMLKGAGLVRLTTTYNGVEDTYEAECGDNASTEGLEEAMLELLALAVVEEVKYLAAQADAIKARSAAVLMQCVEILSESMPKTKLDSYTPPARQLSVGELMGFPRIKGIG